MKDLKISKELISEVLNIPKEAIMDICTDGNYLLIRKTNGRIEEYNIYGFAFKCKEWAYTQGYILKSEINGCLVCKRNTFMGSDTEWFNGISEIEAVVKACNWILKELKNETI